MAGLTTFALAAGLGFSTSAHADSVTNSIKTTATTTSDYASGGSSTAAVDSSATSSDAGSQASSTATTVDSSATAESATTSSDDSTADSSTAAASTATASSVAASTASSANDTTSSADTTATTADQDSSAAVTSAATDNDGTASTTSSVSQLDALATTLSENTDNAPITVALGEISDEDFDAAKALAMKEYEETGTPITLTRLDATGATATVTPKATIVEQASGLLGLVMGGLVSTSSSSVVVPGETVTISVKDNAGAVDLIRSILAGIGDATYKTTYTLYKTTNNGSSWTYVDSNDNGSFDIKATQAMVDSTTYYQIVLGSKYVSNGGVGTILGGWIYVATLNVGDAFVKGLTGGAGTEGSPLSSITVVSAKKAATAISLNIDSDYLLYGATYSASGSTEGTQTFKGTTQVHASLTPDTSTSNITYTSNDTSVATVDANGIVTAVGKGTTTIYATATNSEENSSPVVSNEVTITVGGVIDDESTKVGNTATFTLNGASELEAADVTVNYQWQKAAKGSTTYTNISGANSSSYTTATASMADDKSTYRVVITMNVKTSDYGDTSTVTVTTLPATLTVTSLSALTVNGTTAKADGYTTASTAKQTFYLGTSLADINAALKKLITVASYTATAGTDALSSVALDGGNFDPTVAGDYVVSFTLPTKDGSTALVVTVPVTIKAATANLVVDGTTAVAGSTVTSTKGLSYLVGSTADVAADAKALVTKAEYVTDTTTDAVDKVTEVITDANGATIPSIDTTKAGTYKITYTLPSQNGSDVLTVVVPVTVSNDISSLVVDADPNTTEVDPTKTVYIGSTINEATLKSYIVSATYGTAPNAVSATNDVTLSDDSVDTSTAGTKTIIYTLPSKNGSTELTVPITFTIVTDASSMDAKNEEVYQDDTTYDFDVTTTLDKASAGVQSLFSNYKYADGTKVALSDITVTGTVTSKTVGAYTLTASFDATHGGTLTVASSEKTAVATVTVKQDEATITASDINLNVGQTSNNGSDIIDGNSLSLNTLISSMQKTNGTNGLSDRNKVVITKTGTNEPVENLSTLTPGTYTFTFTYTSDGGHQIVDDAVVTITSHQAADGVDQTVT